MLEYRIDLKLGTLSRSELEGLRDNLKKVLMLARIKIKLEVPELYRGKVLREVRRRFIAAGWIDISFSPFNLTPEGSRNAYSIEMELAN